MKYLTLLFFILAALWWLRLQRNPSSPPSAGRPSGPQTMVACAHCGLHLPEPDSVSGRQGRYCCSEHRQLHES